MNEIVWPEGYLPDTTEYCVSNEVIVAGLGAAGIWWVRCLYARRRFFGGNALPDLTGGGAGDGNRTHVSSLGS
jgi:hypothetical protein